jgi:glycosyltransferase involved in cell wall biosynthesis
MKDELFTKLSKIKKEIHNSHFQNVEFHKIQSEYFSNPYDEMMKILNMLKEQVNILEVPIVSHKKSITRSLIEMVKKSIRTIFKWLIKIFLFPQIQFNNNLVNILSLFIERLHSNEQRIAYLEWYYKRYYDMMKLVAKQIFYQKEKNFFASKTYTGNKKFKIALFSPLPPVKSGTADYFEELLPFLSKFMDGIDIDIYVDQLSVENEKFYEQFTIRYYEDFDEYRNEYDLLFYFIANNPYHAFVYETFMKYPGIVLLHDVCLHHFIFWYYVFIKKDLERYIKELEFSHGEEGIKIGESIIKGHLTQREVYEIMFKFPMIKKVVDRSLGIIVHGNYNLSKLKEINPDKCVLKINHHYFEPKDFILEDKKILRRKYSIDLDKLIISSFGFLSMRKRPEIIFYAISKLSKKYRDFLYIWVGSSEDNINIESLFEKMGLKNQSHCSGYVSKKSLYEYIRMSDIGVNLTYPTAGEISGTTIRCIGMGLPLVISDLPQYSEIPEGVVLKVPPNENEIDLLISCLELLINDKQAREKISERAREYAKKNLSIEKSAEEISIFLKKFL